MSERSQKEIEIFTTRSRADKAINSLKGILLGVIANDVISQIEIEELKKWADNHYDLINRNPFKEFMSIISNTVSQENISKEEIEDLYWLCQKYEGDNYYYNAITSDLQLLQGICHGLLSDGLLDEKEIISLDKWLEGNTHLNSYYPYDEIRSLLLSILSDGKIDNEEKLVLKAYLKQFVNLENKEISQKIDSEIQDINIAAHCTSEPNIEIKSKTFCITGILKSGNRNTIEKQIESLGGITTQSVNKSTDYLIVGDNGNKAWAFACYGRKVEQALTMRKKGHTITLIHEFDFMDVLQDSF